MTIDLINLMLVLVIKPLLVLAFLFSIVKNSFYRPAAVSHWILVSGVISFLFAIIAFFVLPTVSIELIPSALKDLTAIPKDVYSFNLIGVNLDFESTFIVLYCLGLAWHLFKLAMSVGEARYLLTTSKDINDNATSRILKQVCVQLSVSKLPHLLCSERTLSPIMLGMIQPKIILPKDYKYWTEQRLERILAHEVSHIKRNDWITKLTLELLVSIFWFIPLIKRIVKNIENYSEFACDDCVISHYHCREEYANDLLELAVHSQPRLVSGFIERTQLFQRIDAVLDVCRDRRVVTKREKFLILNLFFIIFLPIFIVHASVRPQMIFSDVTIDSNFEDFSFNENTLKPSKTGEDKKDSINLSELKIIATALTESGYSVDLVEAFVTPKANTVNLTGNIDVTSFEPQFNIQGIELHPASREYMVLPKYPGRALQKGIEARIVVAFDINEFGEVINEKIVTDANSEIFNMEVLSAIRKFKYSPMKINNIPTITRDVRETFNFKISDK